MKNIERKELLDHLLNQLIETLTRRFPTRSSEKHLKDIVRALLGSLSRGEIYVNIGVHSRVPPEISSKGWPEEHYKELINSDWINKEGSPLVMINDLIAWRRWHCELNELIKELMSRSNREFIKVNSESKENPVSGKNKLNKEQQNAVNKISDQNLILIKGGPGTGKTSTIAQILVRVLSIKPLIKIGLAAPTGKATRRLQESLLLSAEMLGNKEKQVLSKVPCLTIHKWLKSTNNSFNRNKSNPLQLDLLIIDEMSMVNLNLFKGLLEALPFETQLVLVGDTNQLPPVDSAAIWHYLHSKDLHDSFKNSYISLSKVYRSRGDIARLATIINTKGINTFCCELKKLSQASNVKYDISNKSNIPEYIIKIIKSHQKKLETFSKQITLLNNPDKKTIQLDINEVSEKAFALLSELLVLSSRKYGLWSVDHINNTLLGELSKDDQLNWPEGMPVICGSNQADLGLANGDIGITIGTGNSQSLLFRVIDNDQNKSNLFIKAKRLAKCDPAFAITIHKAQGSESRHVVLLYPHNIKELETSENSNNDYEKKLLYTGITRAKEKLSIFFADDTNE